MDIKGKKNFQIKLGIFLMIFSGVFFGASFIIPMLNLETKTKVIAVSTSLVLMEIVFWSGGLLVGKELFKKYKAYLNPKNWFKKKVKNETNIEN
ncbi:MAG: transporter suffix domain-containing protein [Mariniphaga sp.]|nr:transporter suffix domain-containing protein [Mariniphaga sp.]